jgi:hypothetical protein
MTFFLWVVLVAIEAVEVVDGFVLGDEAVSELLLVILLLLLDGEGVKEWTSRRI